MSKWGWNQKSKLERSLKFRGNKLGTEKLSDELMHDYSDPEVQAWIKEHRGELDTPNEDGTVPLSQAEIERNDGAKSLIEHPSTGQKWII